MQAYYDRVQRYAEILAAQAEPVPSVPGAIRYNSGGARNGCYAALINAYIAEIVPPADCVNEKTRARARQIAVDGLRYLGQGHVAGSGVYSTEDDEEGVAWGGRWQSALYAHAMGLAAWILWPRLPGDVKVGVARVLEYEADRFTHIPPKGNLSGDTKAEENAWNAMAISVACNMMPGHPRNARWCEAAKSYLYNTLSIEADAKNTGPADDGRTVRDWVKTVNMHPDSTLENHGLAHIGYMKTTLAEMMCANVPYLLAAQEVPRAGRHRLPEVFDVLVRCMAWDGTPIYFGGNDWALFHQQASDSVIYALVALLQQDRRAATVEQVISDHLARRQQLEEGFLDVRHDITYTSQCCVRLISAYLAHMVLGDRMPEPLTLEEFDRQVTGVMLLPAGRAVIHRTPTKLVSFTWGAQRMGVAMPHGGNWVVWPHFSSSLGEINGRGPSESAGARLVRLNHDVQPQSFTVAGTLERPRDKVTQDFAFASLRQDVTVYVERLRVAPGTRVNARETGVVGHCYEMGTTTRTLYGPRGPFTVTSVGGNTDVIHLPGNWLNLGNRIGYVVLRQDGRSNVITYHDFSRGRRWPSESQEWVSLIGDPAPILPHQSDWACLATFLNQPSRETREALEQARLEVNGDLGTVLIGDHTVTVDFRECEARIKQQWPG